MIRLMIADDHEVVRQGVRQFFATASDVEVVSEASNAQEVMRLLERETYDLLLLDLTMPGANSLSLISRIHDRFPDQKMLILTMHDELQVAKRAIKAGAHGYILKSSGPDVLISAVRKAASGIRYLDPLFAERLVFSDAIANEGDPLDVLSRRELHILKLLATGMGNNDIAEKLIISNKTVSTHKTRLMKKLGIANNAELMRFAVDHGLGE